MIISARDISKTHGLKTLFTGVSFVVAEGDRVGLIGPNGAGKSTLLKLIAGLETADDGGSIVTAKGAKVVYVPQVDVFPPTATPRAVVTDAAHNGLSGRGPALDFHEAEVLADQILAKVGFDDVHADTPCQGLSGGWRKRLSVAKALGAAGDEPDLLLLDEPTNHLDMDGIRWLEEFFAPPRSGGLGTACVFVTHDRTFLENIANRIVELSVAYPDGTLAADGNYSEFIRRKEEFLDWQSRAQQAMSNQVRKDLDWLSRGPEARRTKSKSRIDSSHGRIDQLAELKARNAAAAVAGARISFNQTERRTRKFIEAKNVSKSMGGRSLFQGVDLALGVGDCLGLLGPNGSGKTTLIRILTGELKPDTGSVTLSDPPPRVAVFSQHRTDFAPTTLLRDALCPVSDQVRYRGQAMHITSWSRRFLFRDEQLAQPISSLSGGEVARVHIARIMLEPADLLVLDEPTNDLDIPTLTTLEEALDDFPGALILVTHDRAMLDRLATEVLSLDGRGGSGIFANVEQAMASARRAGAAEKNAKKAATPTAAGNGSTAAAGGAPARKKLSYNEQREYNAIEHRIMEADKVVAAAEAKLADPRVTSDRQAMAEACRVLGEAQAKAAALYKRWEELEAKLA